MPPPTTPIERSLWVAMPASVLATGMPGGHTGAKPTAVRGSWVHGVPGHHDDDRAGGDDAGRGGRDARPRGGEHVAAGGEGKGASAVATAAGAGGVAVDRAVRRRRPGRVGGDARDDAVA